MKTPSFSPLPFGQTRWISAITTSVIYIIFLSIYIIFSLSYHISPLKKNYMEKVLIELPLNQTDSTLPEKVAGFLKTEKSVKNYKFVEAQKLDSLKILLNTQEFKDFQIPQFIEVFIYPKSWNSEEFEGALKKIHPHINMTNTHSLAQKFIQPLEFLEYGLWVITFLIMLLCLMIVGIATRFEVMIHKETIHILYLLGAKDSYIAHHFQKRARKFGALSSFLGTAAASLSYLFFVILLKTHAITTDEIIFIAAILILGPIIGTIFIGGIAKLSSLALVHKFQQQ